jgi:integrase
VILAEGPDDGPSGPTFAKAAHIFASMRLEATADRAGDENPIALICELFLRHVEATLAPNTLVLRKKAIVPFSEAFGNVRVGRLTRHQVNGWLDTMRQERRSPKGKKMRWNNTTINAAIGIILTMFNWAVDEGLIPRNPLARMKKPKAKSRGRAALIGRTPEERKANHARILAAATKAFRPFIVVLEATGARPGEMANATAADFDAALGAIRYHADSNRLAHEHRHKTAGHGKDRVIFLIGEALEIVKELVRKRPRGPLFRTNKPRRGDRGGEPNGWSSEEIVKQFTAIRKKTGIPELTAYSYRHTFATAWLEQGKPVDILASLMGNTPNVLRQHYSHLMGDTGNLRRQLEAFRASAAEQNGSQQAGPASDGAASV